MIDVTPSSVSVAAATVASDCFSVAPVGSKLARSSARRRAEASAHHASGRGPKLCPVLANQPGRCEAAGHPHTIASGSASSNVAVAGRSVTGPRPGSTELPEPPGTPCGGTPAEQGHSDHAGLPSASGSASSNVVT